MGLSDNPVVIDKYTEHFKACLASFRCET